MPTVKATAIIALDRFLMTTLRLDWCGANLLLVAERRRD
jgi:hypothetical protein